MELQTQNMEDSKLLQEKGSSYPKSTNCSIVLALVTIAQFMIVVDFTIVQIALPTIGRELGISIQGLQWIVTAYGLTLAGFLMFSGRAGDLYGHKRLFITGIVAFSFASLAGGLAPTQFVLITARAIQGIGAAIGSATGLSILVATFPEGKERNSALSIFAAVMGSGFAAGMIGGGFITAELGWRWVFDVNVPIGITAALLSLRFIPAYSAKKSNSHLDLGGAISVTAGLMLLLYSLTLVQSVGLAPETLLFLGLAGTAFASFIAAERRSRAPLVPLGILRRMSVFGANALAVVAVAAYVGMIFILTIYIQQVLGYSSLVAGLAFAPMGFTFLAMSLFSARLANRFGVRIVLVLGMIIETAGYLLLTHLSVEENYLTGLLPPMLFVALGSGLAFTGINIAALNGTRRGEEGLASGLINTSRQIGGSMGVAVMITVASIWTFSDPSNTIQQTLALVTGFGHAFVAATILTTIGILFAFIIRPEGREAIMIPERVSNDKV